MFALGDVGGAPFRGKAHVLIPGESVHPGHLVDNIDLAGQASGGVIDAVDHGGVLVKSDLEGPHRHVNTVNTDVVLAESGGLCLRPPVKAIGIQTVDPGERFRIRCQRNGFR